MEKINKIIIRYSCFSTDVLCALSGRNARQIPKNICEEGYNKDNYKVSQCFQGEGILLPKIWHVKNFFEKKNRNR